MKPNNPFLIAGYRSPEFFCDRKAETATILEALHNGRNVTLIAPHRMGKGVIRHAFYNVKARKSDIVTLYMDIFPTQSLGDFVCLLKAIAKEGCVKEALAGDFISKYRLRAASSVSAALKS